MHIDDVERNLEYGKGGTETTVVSGIGKAEACEVEIHMVVCVRNGGAIIERIADLTPTNRNGKDHDL